MAERRMFSKGVVNSARFLRMPQTSRLLYYDLGMAADDDGVVEAFTVLRTTGAAEDDLRVLASRGFVVVLNEDLVSYISDWKRNNYIRPDRYSPSGYAELLVKITDEHQRYTDGIPNDTQRDTQVRLGKDSIGKDRLVEDNTAAGPPTRSADFDAFWNAYPKKVGKQAAKKAFDRVKVPVKTLLTAVERQKCSAQWSKDGGQYIPNPATWLNQGRWEDELEQTNAGSAAQFQNIPGVTYV